MTMVEKTRMARELIPTCNRFPSIPIVFITAQDDSIGRLRVQAMQLGALAFLQKPFGDEDLLRAVRSVMKKQP